MDLENSKFVKKVQVLIYWLYRILSKLKYKLFINEYQKRKIITILLFIIIVPFLLFGIEKGINFELIEEKQYDKEIGV